MNRNYAATIMIVLGWLCVVNSFAATSEIEKAANYGAKGKITLHVIDSTGKSVENAAIKVGFYNPRESGQVAKGLTDTNGRFVAEGKPITDMHYTIIKDGFYTTEASYVFNTGRSQSVVDGRWQPWNPTYKVVLKEHRQPIGMYAKNVDILIPNHNGPLGFDLEKGDWVAPHGQGSQSDLIFEYHGSYESTSVYTKSLKMTFKNPKDGAQIFNLDRTSEFMSMYTAPEDKYTSTVLFENERIKAKTPRDRMATKNTDMGENQYLVFRIRTVTDKDGKIVSANYGKIYGPFEYGLLGGKYRMQFNYYFNPTANDRNLEFDPSKNLFPITRRHRVYKP